MSFVRLTAAFVSLALIPFALGSAPLASLGQPPQQGTAGPLPESVKYWVLFRHLTVLEAKALEVERHGKDGTPYRTMFRESAKLTEAQAARLSSIAADCIARVEEKDREALAIIHAARAAVPSGKWKKDEIPLEPPAELGRLQRERDELIDAARENLHLALGDKEFARLQGFVDEKIAPTIRRQQIAPTAAVPKLPNRSTRPMPPAGEGRP